tara:strand:+ start:215 stop:388 length:174 start_codon:yes stop_codon:yes gene_type:complete
MHPLIFTAWLALVIWYGSGTAIKYNYKNSPQYLMDQEVKWFTTACDWQLTGKPADHL